MAFDFDAHPLCYLTGITDLGVPIAMKEPRMKTLDDGVLRLMYGDGDLPRSHEVVKVIEQDTGKFVFKDGLGFTITVRPLTVEAFNRVILPHLLVPPDTKIKTEDELMEFAFGEG